MTHPLTPREKVELKPCPFCGGEAEYFSVSDRVGVRCADVMCAGSHRLPSAGEDSVALWNRRTALALAERVLGEDQALEILADEARAALEDTINGSLKRVPIDVCINVILRAKQGEA